MGAILVAAAAFAGVGCGPLIRQAVNKKFPPVPPELRQLGAIEGSERSADALTTPAAYAVLTSDQVLNYAGAVMAEPIPLDANLAKYLAASPILSGFSMTLGRQEVAMTTDFHLELTGAQAGIDLSKVLVGGRIDVRSYPEFVPSESPTIAAAVRLRPALSNLEICDLDLSKTQHKLLYWFEKRKLLSAALNTTLAAFRDNINGRLYLNIPLPLGSVELGRKPEDQGKGGVTITPATVALIQPEITDAVVEVAPTGIRVISGLRIDLLDPSQKPQPQLPPNLPSEPLPGQASQNDIAQHFQNLDRQVDHLLAKTFGSTPLPSPNAALISTHFLSESVNQVFNNKTIGVSYVGPIPENDSKPGGDEIDLPPAPNLYCSDLANIDCNPRGTCVPYLQQLAHTMLEKAEGDCKIASGLLNDALGAIGKACQVLCVDLPFVGNVCAGDLVDPGGCTIARHNQDVANGLLAVCQGTINLADGFLNGVSMAPGEFASRIGKGDFYKNVCTYYDKILDAPDVLACKGLEAAWKTSCGVVQSVVDKVGGAKIGTLDWSIQGTGNDALNANTSFQSFRVDDQLSRVSIAKVNASGTGNVQGWAKVNLDPIFYPVCPPVCIGGDCRIHLDPTTLSFTLPSDTQLGAGFGIASFADPADGHSRPGVFLTPDPLNVTISAQNSAISALLRKNVINLPCIYNTVTWGTYALADLLTLFGTTDVSVQVSPGRQRVGWADTTVQLPLATKPLPMPVSASQATNAIAMSAGALPPAPISPPAQVTQSAVLELSGGIGGTAVFRGSSVQGAFSPYVALFPGGQRVGPFAGLVVGSQVGFGYGAAVRPFKRFDKLLFLVGARAASDGLRPTVGLAWQFGHLQLTGCEMQQR
jgi:hypothetical protein